MDLRDTIRRVLLVNELDSHAPAAYRFSDPDGPKGRSGYSFGICQFDLRHNPGAAGILREAGFDEGEIAALKTQTITSGSPRHGQLNARLKAASAVVDRADLEEFDDIARHTLQVIENGRIPLADEEAFVHLADYHNQYHLDFGGKAVKFLSRLGRPVTAADVLEYKLATAWGQKRPDDVRRRYDNIVRICGEASA
jgi:hypothetical protein